jgi:hypothetical protein
MLENVVGKYMENKSKCWKRLLENLFNRKYQGINIVEEYMENKCKCYGILLENIWKTSLDVGEYC